MERIEKNDWVLVTDTHGSRLIYIESADHAASLQGASIVREIRKPAKLRTPEDTREALVAAVGNFLQCWRAMPHSFKDALDGILDAPVQRLWDALPDGEAADHLAAPAKSLADAAAPRPVEGWEDIDGENADYVNRVTAVVREADRAFEKVGGSSRHWVRDVFLPLLNRAGLRIAPVPDAVCKHGTALDVHCCNCHGGFIFDINHECQPSPPAEAREDDAQAVRDDHRLAAIGRSQKHYRDPEDTREALVKFLRDTATVYASCGVGPTKSTALERLTTDWETDAIRLREAADHLAAPRPVGEQEKKSGDPVVRQIVEKLYGSD